MASEQFSSGPGPQLLTPGTLGSGLVPDPSSPTPYVPPTKEDWEILFQPMFDEYFNAPPSVASSVPTVVALDPADSTSLPSSTSIDKDAPSPKPNYKQSSSTNVISTNVHSLNQPLERLKKWTKYHQLDNVIGSPSRPVSTRNQLQNQAIFCYFDAFLSSVEPKNYKKALKESCWIEAMQEELMSSNDLKFESSFLVQIVGIFLNQSKYSLEIVKKNGMETGDPVNTPMVEKPKLDEYPQGKATDPTHYRGMIGSLMYLTSSRTDLAFDVCMCARCQAKPTEKHLHAAK
nr:retrovirus-related Pol polyprotein from transposon TNT 1-94 [Tanacetum cinerariifolium]